MRYGLSLPLVVLLASCAHGGGATRTKPTASKAPNQQAPTPLSGRGDVRFREKRAEVASLATQWSSVRLATLGDDMICMAMVETRAALDAIDEIAGTPGLDGIYVGPADLALGLGLPPDLDKQEPEHVAAVQKILDACKRHGIVAGIQCGNGRSGRAYAERGFQFVTIAKDSSLLQAAVQREVAAARAEGSEAATRATGYT